MNSQWQLERLDDKEIALMEASVEKTANDQVYKKFLVNILVILSY